MADIVVPTFSANDPLDYGKLTQLANAITLVNASIPKAEVKTDPATGTEVTVKTLTKTSLSPIKVPFDKLNVRYEGDIIDLGVTFKSTPKIFLTVTYPATTTTNRIVVANVKSATPSSFKPEYFVFQWGGKSSQSGTGSFTIDWLAIGEIA